MSATVGIAVEADTREDLLAAQALLAGAGLTIEWEVPERCTVRPALLETTPTHVVGTLQLYDTPETAAAKASAAGNLVRAVIRNLEKP